VNGPVSGFVQTPKGGAPGTTSPNRPRLSELGFDRADVLAGRVALGWTENEVSLEGRTLRMSGAAVLARPLTSQGTTFPAGSAVDSRISVDSWWLGYGRRIALNGKDAPAMDLVPSGGLMYWNFDYRVSAASGAEARRSYGHAAPFLGARFEAATRGPFSFDARARASLPVGTGPLDESLEVRVLYRLWEKRGRGGRLFLGAVGERMSKKDHQTVPNDVEIRFGPAVFAGIEIDL
jgi:hypothetical protein